MSWFVSLPEMVRDFAYLGASAVWFVLLAMAVKGWRRAYRDGLAARDDTGTNFIMWIIDAAAISPFVVAMINIAMDGFQHFGVVAPTQSFWRQIGPIPTLLAALVVGDFIGYWRHRLQHSPWFWPAHAVHHSDEAVNWLTLARAHPLDRLITAVDVLLMAMLGFPVWVITANAMIRHYYGHLLHADVPWTFGKIGEVINSPSMHRWHHARDDAVSGRNFGTLFSIFDRLFGTLYSTARCDAALGVRHHIGRGLIDQYLYPFKVWFRVSPMLDRPAATRSAESLQPLTEPVA